MILQGIPNEYDSVVFLETINNSVCSFLIEKLYGNIQKITITYKGLTLSSILRSNSNLINLKDFTIYCGNDLTLYLILPNNPSILEFKEIF